MEERGRRRKRNRIQQRSKGKEDGRPQVHGVTPHLGSHMIPPLHKAERQTDEQTDRDRLGEEGGETGSVLGRRDKDKENTEEKSVLLKRKMRRRLKFVLVCYFPNQGTDIVLRGQSKSFQERERMTENTENKCE